MKSMSCGFDSCQTPGNPLKHNYNSDFEETILEYGTLGLVWRQIIHVPNEVELTKMNTKSIFAAVVALTIGGASAVPALASDNSKALNQMAMQMYMQQQQVQAQQQYNQAVTNANQAALAEAAWQAQNGAFPYKDQFGRAYGPSGYASGANGNLSLLNRFVPGYNGFVANNVGYNPYAGNYNYGNYNYGNYNNSCNRNNGISRSLNKLSNKLNRTIRYW